MFPEPPGMWALTKNITIRIILFSICYMPPFAKRMPQKQTDMKQIIMTHIKIKPNFAATLPNGNNMKT